MKIQDEPISRLKRFNEKRDEKNIFGLKFNAHANLWSTQRHVRLFLQQIIARYSSDNFVNWFRDSHETNVDLLVRDGLLEVLLESGGDQPDGATVTVHGANVKWELKQLGAVREDTMDGKGLIQKLNLF